MYDTLQQVFTNCTTIIDKKTAPKVIFQARVLWYALHIERYKRLSIIRRRKRIKKPVKFIKIFQPSVIEIMVHPRPTK